MKTTAKAFSLLELLVSIGIVAILAASLIGAADLARGAARQAGSTHNLRQFAAATALYLADHQNTFFPYRQNQPDHSITWWFGHETAASLSSAEGKREVDKAQSPLYPYLQQNGGVEVCPGFIADASITKAKYQGASYGYGLNVLLGGGWMGTAPLANLMRLQTPSNTISFATCAQVNDFEAPASATHPLIEEFYGLDQQFKTIDFRFRDKALILFLDGHVAAMVLCPGTEDNRMGKGRIGRVTPVGSYEMLQ